MKENPNARDPEVQRLRGQFDSLVEGVHEDVLRYAHGITRSYDLGNDMFMEGWWEMLGRYPEIQDIHVNQFRVYFKKVVRNKFFNYYNQKKRESSFDSHRENSLTDQVDFDTEPDQISDSLSQALQKLSTPLREAIILQSEGHSEELSAQTMGISKDDFYELLAEARLSLQASLFQPESSSEMPYTQPKMLTIGQIAERLGKSWISTVNLLTAYKDEATIKSRSNVRNNILFPEDILIDLELTPTSEKPASGWLTADGLSKALGVNHSWVIRRVFLLQSAGEFRKGKNGQTLIHFPPESLNLLREERDRITEYAIQGVDFNVRQLAETLGRHPLWVAKKLIELQIEPQFKRGFNGKVLQFYNEIALQELTQEIEKYPVLGNHVLIRDLERITGMERGWVESKLDELGIQGELRTHPISHKIFKGFHPDAVGKLLRLASEYKPADEGWMTMRSINKVFYPAKWVNRVLAQFESQTVMRRDSRGALRKHYPVEVFSALDEEKQKRAAKKQARKWYESN